MQEGPSYSFKPPLFQPPFFPITSNNTPNDTDLYYLNFPYPASLLDREGIQKGTFVELTGDVSNKGDSEWYGRYQSAVYVRDGNLRKG